MEHPRVPLLLRYVPGANFDACGPQTERVLGVVGFGADRPAGLDPRCPYARVGLRVLGQGPVYEVWTSNLPVTFGAADGITSARNDEVLFGMVHIAEPPDADLELLTFDVYTRLLRFIADAGYGHLLRIYQYLPEITQIAHGIERYRSFNLGRHHAFDAKRLAVETAPAACALGTKGGELLIYFLAARRAGTPVENPRQISAYRYPLRYGPSSPAFSRAMIGNYNGKDLLFISGTASIVGHESMHLGNAAEQTREIATNIRALLSRCEAAGNDPVLDEMLLKVYIRHDENFAEIRRIVEQSVGVCGGIYLKAEICRPELLVEIEGVCPLVRAAGP